MTRINARSQEDVLSDFVRSLGPSEETYAYRYRNARLPISSIIVLPQPRQTFENIPELAADIAHKGMLNPVTVAQFTPSSFERYLAVVNHLWKTSFTSEAFTSIAERKGTLCYYVLLAGERRYRACRMLWDARCEECEQAGRIRPGACFRHHFGGTRFEVRLCANIPPLPALFLQLSENTHVRVPEHEEAHAYHQLFQLLRNVEPGYPLARFARKVGRSPSTIQRALKFCELPVGVQELVEAGAIRYGIAVELSRLHAFGLESDQICWWARHAAAKRYPVPEFRTIVTRQLAELQSGQQSLFLIMTRTEEEAHRRMMVRRTVAEETIQALWGWIGYLQTLIRLFDRGLLGVPDSPFSLRSPRKVLKALLLHLQQLDPHLEELASQSDATALRQEVASIERHLLALEEVTPLVGSLSK